MPRRKKTTQRRLFWPALVASLLLHPAALFLYEATRPAPVPILVVDIAGDGIGVVSSYDNSIFCGDKCSAERESGDRLQLTATAGEKSTFEGWEGPCRPDSAGLFAWGRDAVVRANGEDGDSVSSDLLLRLLTYSKSAEENNPLACIVHVDDMTLVTAKFGNQPEDVDLEWVALNEKTTDEITLPEVDTVELLPPEVVEEEVPEPEEPEVNPEEAPPPEPAPQEEVKKPKPQPEVQKLKSVEVADANEVDKAPDDAVFLSDKNRDVAEQTRATETNLDKQSEGEKIASSESQATESEDIGGEERTIANLEESEASSLDEQVDESAKGGESQVAVGVEAGEEGDGGDSNESEPGMLAMRGIDGRGAPGDPRAYDGDSGSSGRKGAPGLKKQLTFDDYERFVGKDFADQEAAIAKRKLSQKKGRWEKKLGAIQSSLENFTPEVRAGNQTALKTRAAPFAVYIARMHRRIHELWGFGFLEDLSSKPSTHPLNDWELESKIEIVINPDGSIHKTTIVRPSTQLPFDVAALDVVYTSGPFEPTPPEIRSPDGKIYMHWNFHRDWRQCGTFGAHPFILSTAPKQRDKGPGQDADGAFEETLRRRASRPSKQNRSGGAAAASARALSNMPSPDDPEAVFAANQWLTGFTQGSLDKMLATSSTPFRSSGVVVGKTKSELTRVFKNLLRETKNRRPTGTALLSAAGYRKKFGALPKALGGNGSDLYFVVQLKKERFTLVLRSSNSSAYKVMGLFR